MPRHTKPVRSHANWRLATRKERCHSSPSQNFRGLNIHLFESHHRVYTTNSRVKGEVRIDFGDRHLRKLTKQLNLSERPVIIRLVGYEACDRNRTVRDVDSSQHYTSEAADLYVLFAEEQRYSPASAQVTKQHVTFPFEFEFPRMTNPKSHLTWRAGMPVKPFVDEYPWTIERRHMLPPTEFMRGNGASVRIVYCVEAWFKGTSIESCASLRYCPPEPLDLAPPTAGLRPHSVLPKMTFKSHLKGVRPSSRRNQQANIGDMEVRVGLPEWLILGQELPLYLEIRVDNNRVAASSLEIKLLEVKFLQIADIRYHREGNHGQSVIDTAQLVKLRDGHFVHLQQSAFNIVNLVRRREESGVEVYTVHFSSRFGMSSLSPDYSTFLAAIRTKLHATVDVKYGALRAKNSTMKKVNVFPGQPSAYHEISFLDPYHRVKRHPRSLLISLSRAVPEVPVLFDHGMRVSSAKASLQSHQIQDSDSRSVRSGALRDQEPPRGRSSSRRIPLQPITEGSAASHSASQTPNQPRIMSAASTREPTPTGSLRSPRRQLRSPARSEHSAANKLERIVSSALTHPEAVQHQQSTETFADQPESKERAQSRKVYRITSTNAEGEDLTRGPPEEIHAASSRDRSSVYMGDTFATKKQHDRRDYTPPPAFARAIGPAIPYSHQGRTHDLNSGVSGGGFF